MNTRPIFKPRLLESSLAETTDGLFSAISALSAVLGILKFTVLLNIASPLFAMIPPGLLLKPSVTASTFLKSVSIASLETTLPAASIPRPCAPERFVTLKLFQVTVIPGTTRPKLPLRRLICD